MNQDLGKLLRMMKREIQLPKEEEIFLSATLRVGCEMILQSQETPLQKIRRNFSKGVKELEEENTKGRATKTLTLKKMTMSLNRNQNQRSKGFLTLMMNAISKAR